MKIISIDPGFERVGISIIERDSNKKDILIFSECFKTSSKKLLPDRIKEIGQEIEKIIKEYQPKELAIEKLYLTTNQKTVMGVSEARGVIIYCAKINNLEVFEYTPPQIKVAVTGYGKADKNMIMSMVPKLIKIEKEIKSDDEMDSIAIGITHLSIPRNINISRYCK